MKQFLNLTIFWVFMQIHHTFIYYCLILDAILFQPDYIPAHEYVVGGDYDYAPFTYIDKSGKPS